MTKKMTTTSKQYKLKLQFNNMEARAETQLERVQGPGCVKH